jgi:NAD-dependent DNA ligase
MDEVRLNRLSSDRLQSRQIDELIGIARGLIADGAINDAEVLFLEKWLAANLAISHQPLIATLYQRVQEILADGVVDVDERSELFATLRSFSASEFELGEALPATTLPFTIPEPALDFRGRLYCFTGTFHFGQRKHCEAEVIARGGLCGAVTRQTNFLVVGAYATESWKHSSFGNKILKAVELRDAGLPIAIVSETHWVSYLRTS